MKLTLKLMAVILAGIIGLTALDVYLTIRREVRLFDRDMKRDALVLGRSMAYLLEDTWARKGPDAALALIDRINAERGSIHARWVWLDDASDEAHRPRVSSDSLAPALAGKTLSVSHRDPRDGALICSYIPVTITGGRKGALELSESLAERSQYIGSTIKRAIVLAGGIVVLGGVMAVALGVIFVGRPLRLLSEKAGRVGLGDFSGPVHIAGRNELSQLATTINTMCDQVVESQQRLRAESEARIAALEQLRHADRLKTVGRLASGIAHELGTPLNVVGGRASMIASGQLTPGDIADNARIIKTQSDRMATIIRQLLDFARSRPAHREKTDVGGIAVQTVSLLQTLARKRDVNLTITPPAVPICATLDAGQIQQVLTNLIMNAIQSMPDGGTVTVKVQDVSPPAPAADETPQGEWVCLHVADEGAGIAEESLPHIFEPFFTTKDVGEGTGLGLSIAYGMVREHGGRIDVQSEVGHGSTFTVILPRETPACPDES